MDVNEITIGQIVTAISVLGVIIMAIKNVNQAIEEKTKPAKEFKEELEKIKLHQDNDNKRLNDLEKCTKLTLKATRLLLDERIANDDEDGKLAKIKDDIDEYLYN